MFSAFLELATFSAAFNFLILESLNSQFRKMTKTKLIFSNGDNLLICYTNPLNVQQINVP
ncbi:hypothetical protein [Clostridium sp. ZBS13]|uniref:hypothetical protein n=1 Tax=Clostridium sp. ZBS13 TaxID=2949971 RepID=UPI002079C26C|nr:hypothetical protein [Clostridium sp. ZBS13]